MLSFFPRDVLDEIWDLIESVFEGFPTYSFKSVSITTPKSFSNLTFSIATGPVSPLILYIETESRFPTCRWWHFNLLKAFSMFQPNFSAIVMLSCRIIFFSSDFTLQNNFPPSAKSFIHTLIAFRRSLIKK